MTKLTAVVLADGETWTEITDCKVVIKAKYDGYDLDTDGCKTISVERLLDLYNKVISEEAKKLYQELFGEDDA